MSATPPVSPARIAVVTGAAQGIGLAIALRLADDGLDVAVSDLASKADALQSAVAEIQRRGRRALAVPADVSSEESVKALVDTVVKELGGLDVMVANAGIARSKSILELSIEDWEQHMAINVGGSMLCYKYAAIQMIKQGRGGRIIGASSSAGKQGRSHFPSYSASKFAIRGLTQSAAQELAPHNISVNAYAPGFILTPMVLHPYDAASGGAAGSIVKKALGLKPDDPEAGPEVIASIVSYLVKPESYFVTGQTIAVNGGVYMD